MTIAGMNWICIMDSEILLRALMPTRDPPFIDKANVSEVTCQRSTAANRRATI